MDSTLDYASLQKAVLTRLRESLLVGEPAENLLNLVDTAIDYGFYLKDNSGITLDPKALNVLEDK